MGHADSVTSILERSAEGFSLASVFREFDRLRQQLSLRSHGVPGVFTGFTMLNTDETLLRDPRTPDRITVSARVVGEAARSTRVEYRASFTREQCAGWTTMVVAHGSGVTVHPTFREVRSPRR